MGKYLQPFTRYSTKEKPEVPKCQMLAANILKSKCMSNHFNFDAQVDLSEHHVYFDDGTTGASQCTDCSSMQKESFNVISNFAYGTKDGTIRGMKAESGV